MTIAEAGLLARLNSRSQWLFENGYRARIPGFQPLAGGNGEDGPMRIPSHVVWTVEVVSPQGELYGVSIAARILNLAERICPDSEEETEDDGARWLDLSAELTAYQDGVNDLQVGNCTCPFWRKHRGRYWCKHYLGAPLLLARERAADAQAMADHAARVVEAMRAGGALRLCSHHPHSIK